ncbi:VUT family protein [Borreliella valaisiana]|uniref:VUT family protein n=1 Tax=Borreliella valaisiana TaxID=62088 RepID=UPI002ED285A0|nr:VUT family protein [Borreliella valaisiana]
MANELFDLSLWTGISLFIYISLGILYRFFGKLGLFCFNAILSVISNIVILNKLKTFGIYLNTSGIIFLSTLFSLNLITEKYNKKEAIDSAILCFLLKIAFTIMIQFTLRFNHSKSDQLGIHLKILFYNFEYIATVLIGTYLFFLFQYINVLLYFYFKIKIKSLWIIHPLSRLISGFLAGLTSYLSINGLLKFYPEIKAKGLTNGSLTLTLIIIAIDTIFYLFLNSWERVDEV